MVSVVAAIIIIIVFLSLEKYLTIKARNSIKIKILVSGSRGKSTVTKYITAVLQASGIKTISKITGVIPTIFFSDFKEQKIKRFGPARITEQFKMIRFAAKQKIEALVLECMSVNPELQAIEADIFMPDFYILTNIREDHFEELSKDETIRAELICSAFPEKCKIITAEKKYETIISDNVERKSSTLFMAEKTNIPEILRDKVYPDNYFLTLKIAEMLEIPEKTVVDAICIVENKKEKELYEYNLNGFEVNFINAFALNDVTSAEIFIKNLSNENKLHQNVIVILNTRQDRPLRSVSFAEWVAGIENLNYVIVTGTHCQRTSKELLKNNLSSKQIIQWNNKQIDAALKNIKTLVKGNTTVIGIGNIAGDGFKVINSLLTGI